MQATVETYPGYAEAVQKLVEQHRKTQKNRLHLAVYFAPSKKAKRDIYLFEVAEEFGAGQIDPGKKLFTFAYGSTPGFPLPDGVRLWMIVTNPVELDVAIRQNWARVNEIRSARNGGMATVVYSDSKGKSLWNRIK